MNAMVLKGDLPGWKGSRLSPIVDIHWVREPTVEAPVLAPPPKSYAVRSKHISKLRSMLRMSDVLHDDCITLPSQDSILRAIDFINRLPEDRLAKRIGFANDGEIGIFWEGKRTYIDIGFRDGAITSYYAKIGDRELFGDEILSPERWGDLIREIPTAEQL